MTTWDVKQLIKFWGWADFDLGIYQVFQRWHLACANEKNVDVLISDGLISLFRHDIDTVLTKYCHIDKINK